MRLTLISLCFLIFPLSLSAAMQIQVVGLFPGKVVLTVNGNRHIIRKGEATPEGITFVGEQGEGVLLEINGKQSLYQLGGSISTTFVEPEKNSKTLYADPYGMYRTTGSINGQTVAFLVDTGATTIAMNAIEAKRLGIQFRLEGEKTQAQTASGVAAAYAVNLRQVKVGDIAQYNVRALVIDGSYPREVLLGMSFLDRLKVEKSGNAMMLEQKK